MEGNSSSFCERSFASVFSLSHWDSTEKVVLIIKNKIAYCDEVGRSSLGREALYFLRVDVVALTALRLIKPVPDRQTFALASFPNAPTEETRLPMKSFRD